MQQAVTAAAAEVAAAAGVVAAAAGDVAARVAVARLRLAVAQLMAALAVAARVAAAEPVGAAAALALAFGLEAAGAAPEETTPTAGNGIQPRASGSPSAIKGKSGRFRHGRGNLPNVTTMFAPSLALALQQFRQLG